ncbi:MAG: CdaR family protein [Romboutsia sp.]
MIDKMKNNTKIKLISLLSSIVLWLYVMAIVDPQETKVIENLPISINNMNELKDRDLVLTPGIELTTSIYITGKLSNLQKVKPEDIHVYGQIQEPIEGNNEMYLKASISGIVTYEFKTNRINISLDKLIEEKRSIDINIEGTQKDTILDSIRPEIDSIKVSGPRTLVNQVQKVVGNLDLKNAEDDFVTNLKLIPVDEDGKQVVGVELSNSQVNVDVKLLKQKTVPIQVKLQENSEILDDIAKCKLSKNTITIKGKKDVIDKIDLINTQPIDIKALIESDIKEILLDIPQDVIAEYKSVSIQIDGIENITNEFVYSSEELQIKNNEKNLDVSKLDIPSEIRLNLEYTPEISNLTKNDIVIYVDLSEIPSENGYTIKYESKYEFKSISINPKSILIK